MDRQEREDIVHAIGQTLQFYGKQLDDNQVSFWLDALSDCKPFAVKQALRAHIRVGKYAPRPADLLQHIQMVTEGEAAQRKLPPPPMTTSCPDDVAAAWRWAIARFAADGDGPLTATLGRKNENLSPDTEDMYLQIVNAEAKKYDMPLAIPDKFKLTEIWGEL